eukprot:SAG31_NODE_668_length_12945_cov_15.915849_15_plen_76_part_00
MASLIQWPACLPDGGGMVVVQVISKDLIHWQRLPPPIQSSFPADHKDISVWGATGERTFDGSISMLPGTMHYDAL